MTLVGLYAGLLGVLYLVLCYRVVALRRRHRIGVGDGDNVELQKAIRVQANFIEYVPLILLLMISLSTGFTQAWAFHLSGAVLLIARSLHAFGLGKTLGTSFGRYWGIVLTWLLLLVLSLANAVVFIAQLS